MKVVHGKPARRDFPSRCANAERQEGARALTGPGTTHILSRSVVISLSMYEIPRLRVFDADWFATHSHTHIRLSTARFIFLRLMIPGV